MKRYSIAFTAPGRVELESCELTEPELKQMQQEIGYSMKTVSERVDILRTTFPA